MSRAIVPIVEGQAEVQGARILLRRIFDRLQVYDVLVAKPFRQPRTQLVKKGQVQGEKVRNAVTQAIRSRNGASAVLMLIDADDDCPAELGPQLLETCQAATHLPVSVVLANREFEAWFLGAKKSLRGVRSIKLDADAPQDPEDISGAKERLSANMEGNRRYHEVDDQPAFAAEMDIGEAREHCPSFDKLVREVESLVAQIRTGAAD